MRLIRLTTVLLVASSTVACGGGEFTSAPPTDPADPVTPSSVTVSVSDGDELVLSPHTYCMSTATGGMCADGIPPDPLPDAGTFDSPVRFSFPDPGWEFTASMTSSEGYSGGDTDVTPVDAGVWEIALAGRAGPAVVDLHGRGPDGDVAVRFALTLAVDGVEPEPVSDFAAFHPGPNGEVRYNGLSFMASYLGDDTEPQGVVRVEAADGSVADVELGEHQDGPDPEGNGSVSLHAYSPATAPLRDLGPLPYRITLEITIGGTAHRAELVYPDDLDPATTSFHPVFDPPLPSRDD